MARLISFSSEFENRRGPNEPTSGEMTSYVERVAKFVPAEVVAVYLALLPFAKMAPAVQAFYMSWAFFFLGLIVTPFYLSVVAGNIPRKAGQIWLATIAFVVWAYALGVPFELIGWYQGFYAGPALILFTFAAGFFQPLP